MIRNIAVSAIVVTLIQHVNFVCGQNNSTVTYIRSRQSETLSTSRETSGVVSTSILIDTRATSTAMPRRKISESLHKPMSSTLQSTTFVSSATRSKDVTFPIASPTVTYFHATSSSLSPSKSSVNSFGFANKSSANSSGFATSSNLSFTTSTFTSSTYDLTSQRPKNSMPPASSIHSPTAVLSNSTLHLSTTPGIRSTSQYVLSSTRILSSPITGNSTTAIRSATFEKSDSTFVKSTSLFSSFQSFNSFIATSHSRSSSFSSTMFFSTLLSSFSTNMVATTKTSGITTIMSNRESSSDHLSSPPQETSSTLSRSHIGTLSQTFPSSPGLSVISSRNTSLKSSKITTVSPTLSATPTLPSMKSSGRTKTSSSTTRKMASSSSTKVLNNIFLEFDGKLVVSPNSSSNEYYNNLKELAGSIESILDEALKVVNGYFYAKVLLITTRKNQSKFDCIFKLFIRQPSLETAFTLLERIKKYNETNGFGQFTLHSVETSVPSNQSSTEERLYLWAIIVIAALGVLCLVFSAAFIYTRTKLKKSRNQSSPNQDNNSILRYKDFFPTVFDGNDDSQNVPLKLTSISSTESKKPLKLSDAMDTDSDQDEENGKISDEGSIGDGGIKEDKLGVQEPSRPNNVILHVQDTDGEDDQTKFSTFSRKR